MTEKFYEKTLVPNARALGIDLGLTTHVTGCCHSGIINTIECVRSLAPEIRIRAIVGGLHLCWATEDEVVRVAEYLNRLNLERLVLLHCTGESASAYLLRHVKCPTSVGAAGESWTF